MRTVSWLIDELKKFPPYAMCFAYEGEVSGVVVEPPVGSRFVGQGVIYCSEYDDSGRETEPLTIDQSREKGIEVASGILNP